MRGFALVLAAVLAAGSASAGVGGAGGVSYPTLFVPLSGDAVMLSYLTGALRTQTGDNANDIGTTVHRWRDALVGRTYIGSHLGSAANTSAQDAIRTQPSGAIAAFYRPFAAYPSSIATVPVTWLDRDVSYGGISYDFGSWRMTGTSGAISLLLGKESGFDFFDLATTGTGNVEFWNITTNDFITAGPAFGTRMESHSAPGAQMVAFSGIVQVESTAALSLLRGTSVNLTANTTDVVMTALTSHLIRPGLSGTEALGSAGFPFLSGTFGGAASFVQVGSGGNSSKLVQAAPAATGEFRETNANGFMQYHDGTALRSLCTTGTGQRANASLFAFGVNGNVMNGTRFYTLNGTGSGASATSAQQAPLPGSIVKSLRCRVGTAIGGADTLVLTVLKNGAATAITCTISGAGTTCSDLSNTSTFSAGDTIIMQGVASAAGAANLLCTVVSEFQ